MPQDSGRFDAPADAALMPFRFYAAFLASAHEGAAAFSQATTEMTASLLTLCAQQARTRLDWAQAAGQALGDLANTTMAAQAAAARSLESGNIPRDTPKSTQEVAMRVSECMTREVQIVDPNDTIAGAAKTMAKLDAGILPVGEDDRLIGMITDRDIAVRAVAAGMGPNARVGDVMNSEVKYCFDDQEIDEVLRNMGELQVRRLPVLNREKRLVGIISIGDLAANGQAKGAADALSQISRPGGRHSQTAQTAH
jgi:CBS domain-containing protein